MEEIKVGDYIRTDKGIISKINSGTDIDMLEFENAIIGEIVKYSKTIIDLIEEGDYVNGEQIDFISISKEGTKIPLIRDNIYFFDKYNSIKSIVTKEMFNQVKYEV